MTTFATEKTNNQPHGLTCGRLAVWFAMVAQVGQRLAARLTIGGVANALALMVWSGVWLSSFSAEPKPPHIPRAGEKVRITPFILVVKTDQIDEKNAFVAEKMAKKKAESGLPVARHFFTSGINQFRLSLHPFARYHFTIDWGDGTKEVVRSGAAAGKVIIDEAWLGQVKKGLEQPVTVDFKNIPLNFASVKEFGGQMHLSYLLEKAGIDLCANVIEDPNLWENSANEKDELPWNVPLKVEEMKLGDVFKQLTKLTGLTYVLHDRALLFAKRKDIPSLVCPQHTYAKAGTYTVKITENVIGGFPQIYFNGGYDCVKVIELAQWGSGTWATMKNAFMGCVNMTISASDTATAVTGAVKEFNNAWSGCRGLTSFPLLNTAAGTDFIEAWSGCSGLTSFPLLNTAAGENFRDAWSGCSGLTSFPLLNTAAGKNFVATWSGCSGLTSFPLLNTSAGTYFSQAWSGCSGLTSFPLLKTVAGTRFEYSWYNCSGLTSFPLLNTYAGTDFSGAWRGCSGLTSFPGVSTSSGKNFDLAWCECSGLTSFPWLDTSGGKNFDHAWSGCRGLTSFPLLNFGKMEKAESCFSGVTLTSASYGELLANIAALNKTAKVTFDGGASKTSDQNGIQAREKLRKELGWTIIDGDRAKPVSPALPQEANDL